MIRDYLYRCPARHERQRRHPMTWPHATVCMCGQPMHRVPQKVGVVWGGLRPSLAGIGPAARELLDANNQARWRDAYAAKKAARGEKWP